ERIPAHTVLWAAGVRASGLGQALAKATTLTLDRGGRVPVQLDLSVAGHPEIFVIGDMAACSDSACKPLPGIAPVAMQQGRYVAGLVRSRLSSKELPPFHYRDMG